MSSVATFCTTSLSLPSPPHSPLLPLIHWAQKGQRGEVKFPFPTGNGYATVQLGPASALGKISAGKSPRRMEVWLEEGKIGHSGGCYGGYKLGLWERVSCIGKKRKRDSALYDSM